MVLNTHNTNPLKIRQKKFGIRKFFKISTTFKYSQTCIKRSPLGERKSSLTTQASYIDSDCPFGIFKLFLPPKRGSIHMKFSMTGQENGAFITGDCLIEVTAWADLTVHFQNMDVA